MYVQFTSCVYGEALQQSLKSLFRISNSLGRALQRSLKALDLRRISDSLREDSQWPLIILQFTLIEAFF